MKAFSSQNMFVLTLQSSFPHELCVKCPWTEPYLRGHVPRAPYLRGQGFLGKLKNHSKIYPNAPPAILSNIFSKIFAVATSIKSLYLIIFSGEVMGKLRLEAPGTIYPRYASALWARKIKITKRKSSFLQNSCIQYKQETLWSIKCGSWYF